MWQYHKYPFWHVTAPTILTYDDFKIVTSAACPMQGLTETKIFSTKDAVLAYRSKS